MKKPKGETEYALRLRGNRQGNEGFDGEVLQQEENFRAWRGVGRSAAMGCGDLARVCFQKV